MSAPSASDLRRLWESGEHATALRAALEHWDRLLSSGEDVQWLERALRCSGLPVESVALQAHLARRSGEVRSWELLIDSVLHSGDPWWARDLLAECPIASRRLQALRVEVDLALGDASPAIRAWEDAYGDVAARDAAIGWWIAAGQIGEAERMLAGRDDLPLWSARLALWRGETERARVLAAQLPASDEARVIAAASAVMEGRFGAAEPLLRGLVDGDAQAQAWSWLATLLRKQGRYEEAKSAADAANIATPAFSPAPRFERELASELECVGERARRSSPLAWLRRRLGRAAERLVQDLEYAPLLYPLGLQPRDPLGKLELAIERLRGNRTPHPTVVENGALRSLCLPTDPRHLGATLQVVLWTRGVDALRALYREIGARVDHHPLFEIYRGEIELWMGEYATAEAIFRAVLARDRMTRWAWIGLGGTLMYQGDLERAQETWAEGVATTRFEGPTLFVLRGECSRLQGRIEDARRDLEEALRQKPQRLSARINLALLDDDPARLEDALRRCEEFAPILMHELSGTPRRRLEQVLVAMRGNRSSSPWLMCYQLWGRVWRRADGFPSRVGP